MTGYASGLDLMHADNGRFIAGVLLIGAVLGVIGNALHPIILPEVGVEGFLDRVAETRYWLALHLLLVVGIALVVAGVVLLARWLAATPGGSLATLSAVFAGIGGTIAIAQIAALDGYVLAALAEELATGANPEVVLTTAAAFLALDFALVSLWMVLLFGGTFLTLGLALQRAGVFAVWLHWLSLAVGGTGVVVGSMMFLQLADAFTFVAFRLVGLAGTIVAIGLSVQLLRGGSAPPGRGVVQPRAVRRGRQRA